MARSLSPTTSGDLREVVPGIWAPQRIEYESLNIRDDGASRLQLRRRLRVAAYHPDAIVPPAALALDISYGIDVIDRRSGHSYHNDPWWPEIGAMLREKYDWPKLDLSPLRNLGSPSRNKLDNQPAPPLRVASWLNSEPRDLAALRGKVVLLEFWNIAVPFHRPLVPALKHLYATYHPAGLEMIAIHSPTVDPDELHRFVKEYGITYPVAVDAKGPEFWARRPTPTAPAMRPMRSSSIATGRFIPSGRRRSTAARSSRHCSRS